MKRIFLSAIALYFILMVNAQYPLWLEQDSVKAIEYRLKSDFSLSINEAKVELLKLYPSFDVSKIDEYIESNYLETMLIDGEKRMHRKSPRNFKLLNPEIRGAWNGRGGKPDKDDINMVKSILVTSDGKGGICSGKKIKYKFSITVPIHDFLKNDTLRVWMPVPIESSRQKNVKILSVSHNEYVLSANNNTEHNTIYIESPISSVKDSIAYFEYVGEYESYAQYFSPEYIKSHILDYKKDSKEYIKYTDLSHKHIICDSLAYEIVGVEKCPYKQSELIYEYISKTFPWAGAREYSTIESLPQYVLDKGHGDCGQVALLYISLMRTLGVPARWESGWMLHPWSKNLHDWAEVYFEGVGWVPVDVSFGRYVEFSDMNIRNFFSTGMDCYRFATNTGICSPLIPNKRFIRSETVDFQVGEVECGKGNLFYPGWKKKLEVLSINEL